MSEGRTNLGSLTKFFNLNSFVIKHISWEKDWNIIISIFFVAYITSNSLHSYWCLFVSYVPNAIAHRWNWPLVLGYVCANGKNMHHFKSDNSITYDSFILDVYRIINLFECVKLLIDKK